MGKRRAFGEIREHPSQEEDLTLLLGKRGGLLPLPRDSKEKKEGDL